MLLPPRYRVERALGSGAMGEVYAAHDLDLDRVVAVKVLRADAEQLAGALQREFELLSGVVHPNIVRVLDFGRARDGRPFYAAERLEGASLGDFVQGRRYADARRAILGALRGLAHLHDRGIRHGDVKPDNVVVTADGEGVLVDLSAGQRLERLDPELSGTLGYLAPEVLAGDAPTASADLFAFGRTLEAIFYALEHVPEDTRRAARWASASSPAERPPDAHALLEALGETSAPGEAADAPALLGRAALLDVVEARISRLGRANEPGVAVTVVGPSGSGRSRALREVAWRAQRRAPTFERTRHNRISALLARATGAAVDDSVLGVVEAAGRLTSPTVLLCDDLDRRDPETRAQWRALARLATEQPHLALFATTRDVEADEAGEAGETFALEPLDEQDVLRWLGRWLSERSVEHALAITGGWPAALHRLGAALAAGRVTEDRLEHGAKSPLEVPDELGPEARQLLARAAVAAELENAVRPEGAAEAGAASELVARGLCHLRRGELRLTAGLSPRATQAALAVESTGAHRAALDALEGASSDRASAARALHRFTLGEAEGTALAFPRPPTDAWLPLARRLASSARDASTLVRVAEVLEALGRRREALAPLARAMRARPDGELAAAMHRTIAGVRLRMGWLSAAGRHIERGRRCTSDATTLAELSDLESRARAKAGAYAEARAIATRAIDDAPKDVPSAVLARLHDDAAVAAGYVGDTEAARRHLDEAAARHDGSADPVASIRSLAYRGFVELRAGAMREAARVFARALDLAERQRRADDIAHAALNLGSADHYLGHLGRARACYERALRLAVALGKRGSAATAAFNVARLHVDLGELERAEASLSRARALAVEAERAFFVHACDAVRGEVALLRGELDDAEPVLERAREGFAGAGAERERAEVTLHLASLARRRGDLPAARARLQAVGETSSPDVALRLALAEAELAVALGDASLATEALQRAVDHLASEPQPALIAEGHGRVADVYRGLGARTLAADHAHRARLAWERIASSLPADARARFFRHPRRAALPAPVAEPASGARDVKLERLVAVNKQLNSSLELDAVLSIAIDAAIELTGAERGFVLLREDPGLRVAVARNVDALGLASPRKDPEGRMHADFSRSIAEQVIRSAEAVITTDAQTDRRFEAEASVHLLQLKSVLCVPIASPAGVLGALYLDNRFQRGRFEGADRDLLRAFADQVAIALSNARLHEALRRRTAELEEERQRVLSLVAGQAKKIDELEQRVDAQRRTLQTRYDYARIIGRGPAMRETLQLLDRVIDSDVPILVVGESGTGKELIARAVHSNSPRCDASFVPINCGAVSPELLESEFFGHERGSFTGATEARRGLFEEADGGTLFLDEVSEMPLALQVKLLRVLQEKEVRPVGATRARPVDVRVVCATNRDLEARVASGAFREDLYYRIRVVEVRVPPLRERPEDLPELVRHFAAEAASRTGREAPTIAPGALAKLVAHPWPGNVRELQNTLTRAVVLAGGAKIAPQHLHLGSQPTAAPRTRGEHRAQEATRLRAALEASGWNVSEAARSLNISRPTVYRRMRKYGLVDSIS